MKYNILVLGGWADNTFGTLRQLEPIRNINLICADSAKFRAVHFSKLCKKSYRLPPYEDPSCIKKIFKICKQDKIDILLPTVQPAMVEVSKNKEKFLKAGVKLSLPDYDILKKTIDKIFLYNHCLKHHIDQPKTFLLSDYSINQIFEESTFPLIIKQRAGTGQHDQKLVYNKQDCIKHLNKICKTNKKSHIIIQEYIPGLPLDYMYTTGLLYNHKHKLKAVIPTKKVRELPFSPGGTGVCVKSENNIKVKNFCINLMDSFKKWEGIADIETKIDPRDNKVKLIEINPRPWGPMHNVYVAGVNFTYLWIKTALKQDFKPILNFKENVYTVFITRDIIMFLNLLHNLFSKHWYSILRILKTYKYPYLIRNHNYSISPDLVLRDIKPFLVNLYRLKKELFFGLFPKFMFKKYRRY